MSASARKSVGDNADTRDSGLSLPSVCEGDTFVSASWIDGGVLSDTQHSPGSDCSLLMHEDVESVAGSDRDEETEGEEGESVHDVMNFTQRSRSVSPVRSRSPSIPPPPSYSARRDRVPGASPLRRAELSLHVRSPYVCKTRSTHSLCLAARTARER